MALLFALILSLDALGIGISYGIRGIKISIVPKIIISLLAALFTAISLYAGTILTNILPGETAKYIGVFILASMGIWIILQSKEENKPQEKKSDSKVSQIIIKSLGITIQIIRDPKRGDINKSNNIEAFEALYIGAALSLDSLSLGIAMASLGFNNYYIPIAVGIFHYVFLAAGSSFGSRLQAKNKNGRVWVIISGGLLIAIAIYRMF